MRELIFRGKNTRDGEWVISDSIIQLSEDRVELYDECNKRWYDIDPATVGQFTGANDNHGVNIFEGDIVKREFTLWHGDTKQTRETQIGVVVFTESEFRVNVAKGVSSFFCLGYHWEGDIIEVIGNIYDNEDLL